MLIYKRRLDACVLRSFAPFHKVSTNARYIVYYRIITVD